MSIKLYFWFFSSCKCSQWKEKKAKWWSFFEASLTKLHQVGSKIHYPNSELYFRKKICTFQHTCNSLNFSWRVKNLSTLHQNNFGQSILITSGLKFFSAAKCSCKLLETPEIDSITNKERTIWYITHKKDMYPESQKAVDLI